MVTGGVRTATAPLRLLFFGTPEFAVPTLAALVESRHRVVGVVTQPDKPRGRGQRVKASPVKRLAERHGLPVLQPSKLGDAGVPASLQALNPDLGVVAAYGKILTDAVLSIPRLGVLNLHASLLPRYRGAAPIQRAVMAGDQETGVTIMRVVRELDAGPTLASRVHPIGPRDTSEDVEGALAGLGARLLVEVLDAVVAGTAREQPQDSSLATYAPRLSKPEGLIEWNSPTAQIHDRIRGLRPWPCAYTYLDGVRYVLLESEPAGAPQSPPPGREPGTILEAKGDELRVATADGGLHVLALQLEGRRPLRTREFLAGHRLTPGSRFGPGPDT
jgi:methionyl-tRNA formyltransferase